MNSSKQMSRHVAFALLLVGASACGDDGGGEDDVFPGDDAAVDEDGGWPSEDGSIPSDDGSIDGGGGNLDATVALDATVVDGSATDAGDDELQAALSRDGIRTDPQRAALVIPAFCQKGAECGFMPGITEADCLNMINADWNAALAEGDSPACLDGQLDFWSCSSQIVCGTSACVELFMEVQTLCGVEPEN